MDILSLLNLLERVLGPSKRANGNYYMFNSPFITHHNPKLNINLENGKWKCWKTGIFGSSIFSLLKKINAPKKFFKELNILIPSSSPQLIKTTNSDTISLPINFTPLSSPKSDFYYKKMLNYVLSRNLTLLDIIYYNIGYCSEGEFKDYIIIPSYDIDYNLNYYIGKNINPGGRYKNIQSKIVSRTNIIFFESTINWNFPINLTEGIFDAITLKRNTIPLLGKEVYDNLLLILLKHNVKEVNVYLDNDVTYLEKEKIYNKLTSFNILCNIIDLCEGKDVNEVGYTSAISNSKEFEMSFEEKIKRRLNAS